MRESNVQVVNSGFTELHWPVACMQTNECRLVKQKTE
jgi:hypothetical protein